MREYVAENCTDLTYGNGTEACAGDPIWDEILAVVQKADERDFSRIIAGKADARMLFHLSPQRQNIVAGLELDKKKTVLEIGSGCGAVTGKLAQKAKSVTCVEASKKKSEINACRNRGYGNIEIHTGCFEKIHADLNRQFDVITMIGTLENLRDFMCTELSAQKLLSTAAQHLLPEGEMVIAFDNKYGLKYWAGCKENPDREFFENLESYGEEESARCYSLRSFRRILEKAGLRELACYYPYPDYRYTRCIYSDDFLPSGGELINNMNNYGTERLLLFDEVKVYNGLIADGLFPMFSNSFLMVCGRKELS